MPHASATTALVVFTRDLRVHDNPALSAAVRSARHVVPVFVHDTHLHATGFAAGPRRAFLASCLSDLDQRLRARGAALIVRHGEIATEVARLAQRTEAGEVHIATDVSGFSLDRERRLTSALNASGRRLVRHGGAHTVVGPGAVTPAGNDHFAVFTPYHRRWCTAPRRAVQAAPRVLSLPPDLPAPAAVAAGSEVYGWPAGETAARRRARHWLAHGVDAYADQHNNLSCEATSALSPYLHFGCVSALELAGRAAERDTPGAAAFVRQLAWRDFHHQVLAARPGAAGADYRARGDRWRDDPDALTAWRTGRTGIPIVDAGMRQLAGAHWMHNRARLITASFLTKTLYLDWRVGAVHFADLLLDADIADNQLNWQWVAGTGTDTRPNRVLNPLRQADRYDPTGDYVRRWVPELADVDDPRVLHRPWRKGPGFLEARNYPPPIVDLDAARDRFHHHRQLARDL